MHPLNIHTKQVWEANDKLQITFTSSFSPLMLGLSTVKSNVPPVASSTTLLTFDKYLWTIVSIFQVGAVHLQFVCIEENGGGRGIFPFQSEDSTASQNLSKGIYFFLVFYLLII